MADKETIDALLGNLKKALESGQELNASEVPYLVIKGEIDGKGILWSGHGYNKQFIFTLNPDKFFSSESIDLAKNKSISINGLPVISSNELGSSVSKSSLKEVGRLKGLIVDGSVSVNSYLYYDAVTDRLGIGTENPKAIIDLVDQNVEILIGASAPNVGSIGTFNSQDFSINTDNTSRVTISAGGDILLGNTNTRSTNVTVLGTLAVNVNQIDPRAQLQVSGPVKFNNKLHLSGTAAPDNGVFNVGDIVWNSNPQPGHHVGWICTRAGTPGLWNPFGRID